MLSGCASMKTLEDTGSAPTYGTKSSGDSFTAANHNVLYNAVTDNDTRLDAIEAITGVVFSDGDGTYTDMSSVSSTELGYLNGLTGAIQEQALDTTNFDNNLSAADSTIQLAMETLDEMVAGGGTAASGITFTPAGDISATDVQAMGEELDDEKEAALGNPASDGYVLSSTAAGVRSWVSSGSSGDTISSGDTSIAITDTGSGQVDMTIDGTLNKRYTDGYELRADNHKIYPAATTSGNDYGWCAYDNDDTTYRCLTFENANLPVLTLPAISFDMSAATVTMGELAVSNGANSGGYIYFYEDSDNGTNTFQIIANSSLTANRVMTLPDYTVGLLSSGNVDSSGDLAVTALATTPTTKTAAYTIGTDDAQECYGGTVYVTSAATITACDGLASGMWFKVVTVGAIAVSLDVQSDDLMYLDGTALDDGDKATNTSTTGDTIYCEYYNSTGWFCWSGSPDGDHWTDGGA